jgi:hypothetical protein
LTRELRDQRVQGSRALLDVFRQQEKTQFRDVITGDEPWIFIDAAPSSIWMSLDGELSTRPRGTISADKSMLTAFLGIKGLVHVNWLPKDVRIKAVYFRDEILIPISYKPQTNVSGRHKPWIRVHMANANVHMAKVVSSIMPDLRLKRTRQPPYSPDICPSDIFLFGWSKGKLQQQKQFADPDKIFEAVDEIFSALSVDMIEDLFQNRIYPLVQYNPISQFSLMNLILIWVLLHRRLCLVYCSGKYL